MLKRVLNQTLDFLLPPTCLHCDAFLARGDSGGLCLSCFETLQPHTGAQCHRCATQVDALFVRTDLLCGACASQPPAFSSAQAPFVYSGPARTAVLRLKYENHPGAAGFLARAMAARLSSNPQVLVPVPLHSSRLRQRGFNQSMVLAKRIHRLRQDITSLPLQTVVRTKATAKQGAHSARQRMRNVAGAFQVLKPAAIAQKDILIIDDVMTTGATCRSLAKALQKAGARSTHILAATRALPR